MARRWSAAERQAVVAAAKSGRAYSRLAREYGVTRSVIGGLVHRDRYPPPPRQPRAKRQGRLFTHQVNIGVDAEMYAAIRALIKPGQTLSQIGRELLEWGLEATGQ